jgi:hypothetical protein
VLQFALLIENYQKGTERLHDISLFPVSSIVSAIGRESTKETLLAPLPPPHSILAIPPPRPPDPPLEDRPPIPGRLSVLPFPKLKLSLVTTFQIIHNYHYMMINGHRVGFFRYSPNSLDECNLGLQQTAHLVWCLLESFGIAVPDLCIKPNGVIERRGGECLLLEVPASLDSKSVAHFNAALQGLFTVCASMFASRPLVGFCSMPPFFIDVEKRIIECVPYTFADKTRDTWSDAMKYLLFDLKVMQVRCLERYVSLCSKAPDE